MEQANLKESWGSHNTVLGSTCACFGVGLSIRTPLLCEDGFPIRPAQGGKRRGQEYSFLGIEYDDGKL